MSSLRRILASRANGARSKGPKTPQGKRRASSNSLRHGLLADCVVLPNESRTAFESLLACHLDRFDPVDGVEFGMIEEMTAAYWRMRRAWTIEKRIFEDGLASRAEVPDDEVGRIAAAFNNLATSPNLALLHRYETRLHLVYQRGLHNLLLLRAYSPTPVPGGADPPVCAGPPGPALLPPPALPPPPVDTAPCQTNLVPRTDTVPTFHLVARNSGDAGIPIAEEPCSTGAPGAVGCRWTRRQ